jgi:hypothetical protein
LFHLNEVSEKDATGIVADIYQDIRVRLGLPMVNLIYRHLATNPELFEMVWSTVAQLLDEGDITKTVTPYMGTMKATWIEPIPAHVS